LLIAPFGATAVLIFGRPASPLAQPMNILSGYLVAALVAAAALAWLPDLWWSATIAVGVAIALMLALRVTHPPAGAIPIVAFSSSMSFELLITVVVVGSVSLVAIATAHHRLPPRQDYPKRL
jgi:CBS-domain-containing membrane protein